MIVWCFPPYCIMALTHIFAAWDESYHYLILSYYMTILYASPSSVLIELEEPLDQVQQNRSWRLPAVYWALHPQFRVGFGTPRAAKTYQYTKSPPEVFGSLGPRVKNKNPQLGISHILYIYTIYIYYIYIHIFYIKKNWFQTSPSCSPIQPTNIDRTAHVDPKANEELDPTAAVPRI
jgi:hypothetical protein